jgi:hypothetical protein
VGTLDATMSARSHALLLLLAGLLLGGCYGALDPAGPGGGEGDDDAVGPDDDDDDDDDGPVPVALACHAEAASLTYPWMEPASVQLDLEAQWSDGQVGPPTGTVTWTVLDDFGGTIDADGLYTAPGNHGGRASIEAWYDGHYAVCSIDCFLAIEVDLTGQGAGDVAEGIVPTVDDACGPLVVYPLPGSLMPRNLAPPTFQWSTPPGADAFVLTIANQYASATVTTFAPSYRPDDGTWFALADASAGEQLDVRVAAGSWDGSAFVNGLCEGSTSLDLPIGDFGLEGTVYYWSPTTSGLWKINVGDDEAEPWLGPDNTGWCVGCHTVNYADPSRMAMNYGGGNQWAVVTDPLDPLAPLIPPEDRRGNFMTLDPTGSRLVRSYEGVLYLDDLGTGAELGVIPTTGHATHPNWSADGDRIVYASCEGATNGYDWHPFGCSIAVLQVLPDDEFGATEILVPAGGGHSFYYPTFSPDGLWIAFNRSPAEGDAYDHVGAELMIVRTTGGPAIHLAAANAGTDLTNSWPRWGMSDDSLAWLAFASRRPYGHTTDGVAQVWIAGVDLKVAGTGPDPSYAPVWLPGQDPAAGNHTPIWVPRYTAPE